MQSIKITRIDLPQEEGSETSCANSDEHLPK